uniref:Sulfatase domain-containing protein n=1 Tax=Ascaris lumbricoides TaxID=6252 RepID=A0A0M3IEI3_ASCLU
MFGGEFGMSSLSHPRADCVMPIHEALKQHWLLPQNVLEQICAYTTKHHVGFDNDARSSTEITSLPQFWGTKAAAVGLAYTLSRLRKKFQSIARARRNARSITEQLTVGNKPTDAL